MAGDERRAVDNVRLEARSISEKKWLASYVTFFAFKKKKNRNENLMGEQKHNQISISFT